MIMTNAHNAIIQIIERKNLITILMGNAYAMLDTMMIEKINYAYSVIIVG